jgi:uncharacterized membrane protein (GlpM family)
MSRSQRRTALDARGRCETETVRQPAPRRGAPPHESARVHDSPPTKRHFTRVRALHCAVAVNDLVLRFALGGVAVSLFSAVSELFKPKSFSGIFGAAPAVALVSLALTFEQRGKAVVHDHAQGMICGGLGFLMYACACVYTTANRRIPVWAGAVLCWGAWFLVAASAWFVMRPF